MNKFERPEPTKELREAAYEILEGVNEDTSVFWNTLDAVILGEYRVWNLFVEGDGVAVLVRDLSADGWEDWFDTE